MKFVKKNLKWIVLVIVLLILTGGASVYATATYLATNVSYTKTGTNVSTVAEALNDLYSKLPSGTKTITEKGSQIDVSKYQYADTTGLYTADEAQSGEGNYWVHYTTTIQSDKKLEYNFGYTPKFFFLKINQVRGYAGKYTYWSSNSSETINYYYVYNSIQNDNTNVVKTSTSMKVINGKLSFNPTSDDWIGASVELWAIKN